MSQDKAKLSQGEALAESHGKEAMDVEKLPTHRAPRTRASALVPLNLAILWNHHGRCGPT